jgi:hypothetical protein
MSSLKNFDLFYSPVNLRLNKHKFIKSNIGGCLSILTLIIVTVFTWYLCNDIFYKQRPYVYLQNFRQESSNHVINYENFPMAFSIKNYEHDNLDFNNFLEINFQSVESKNQGNEGKKLFYPEIKKLKTCQITDFPLSIINEYILANNFSNNFNDKKYCIENYNYNLTGFSMFNSEIKYFEINLNLCNNATNPNCKTKLEIENFLIKNKPILVMYYLDTTISFSNFSYPLEKHFKLYEKKIQSSMFKEIKFNFHEIILQTDFGLFSEEMENINFISLEKYNEEIEVMSDYNTLINYKFFYSNFSKLTHRSYLKLPHVMAIMGGLIKFLSMFTQVLNFYIADFEKDLILMKTLFKSSSAKKIYRTYNKEDSVNFQNEQVKIKKSFHIDMSIHELIARQSMEKQNSNLNNSGAFLNNLEVYNRVNKSNLSNLQQLVPESNFFDCNVAQPQNKQIVNILNVATLQDPVNDSIAVDQKVLKNNYFQNKVKKENNCLEDTKGNFLTLPNEPKSRTTSTYPNVNFLLKLKFILNLVFKCPLKNTLLINQFMKERLEANFYFDYIKIIRKMKEVEKIKKAVVNLNESLNNGLSFSRGKDKNDFEI